MYNRYIPQSDGSYCRRQLPDSIPKKPPATSPDRPIPPAEPEIHKQAPQKQETHPPRCKRCTAPKYAAHHPQDTKPSGIRDFLSTLLPKDFDTADLMVILLLLLMSGDCQEDQNTALLTLALYLFL